MKIAIIGAGVSGLTTAYYLRKQIPGVQISIYEKALKPGGNANTFEVVLNNGATRWVDMGVNDFNKATYDHLVTLWTELGIMNDNYCKPLRNDESFCYASSSNPYRYNIELDGSITVPPGGLANQSLISSQMERFKDLLADWYKNAGDEGHASKISVGEWLQQNNFPNEFIYGNLYPRINGMYFTQELSQATVPPPSTMPLWMVAHYYILQEGYGENTVDNADYWTRQYFVDGSSKWLYFLANVIQQQGTNIYYGYDRLHVDRYQNRMTLYNGCVKVDDFDKVIFATHADDTLAMLDFKYRSNDAMIEALTQFSYDVCTVYAHQDNSMLAPQGDCNRTYNIHIYDYTSETDNPMMKKPYTITYIVNYHQNDPQPLRDPLFYVTVNPFRMLDSSLILKQTNGQLATTTFKHCKLDVNAMNAQVAIDAMQLTSPGSRDYYYVGSFSRGAGLHEECIIQAIELSKKIANPGYVSEQTYNFEDDARSFAPKYLLNKIKRKPQTA